MTNPWQYLETFGPPNVDWCEKSIGGLITEPANTWSNLVFIFMAMVIWRQSTTSSHPFLKAFAPSALFLGFASGIYHASSTFFFQVADFLGMFLVFLIPFFINLQRLNISNSFTSIKIYLITSLLLTALVPVLYNVGFPIQAMVGIIAVGILATEFLIWRFIGPSSYRNTFFKGISCLAVASIASMLDVTRTICDPDNHWIQGHAVWHVFSAATAYYCFHYYKSVIEENLSALKFLR